MKLFKKVCVLSLLVLSIGSSVAFGAQTKLNCTASTTAGITSDKDVGVSPHAPVHSTHGSNAGAGR